MHHAVPGPPRIRLHTERVTAGKLLHADIVRHLDFSVQKHRVVLQLCVIDATDLAHRARLAAQWGNSDIRLDCGCPSERVQRGEFGACLMAEPNLTADCVEAMQVAVDMPVTVKRRIGIYRRKSRLRPSC